jgi:hypothetical protein
MKDLARTRAMHSFVHEFHIDGSRKGPAAPSRSVCLINRLVVRPAWGIPNGLRLSSGLRETTRF